MSDKPLTARTRTERIRQRRRKRGGELNKREIGIPTDTERRLFQLERCFSTDLRALRIVLNRQTQTLTTLILWMAQSANSPISMDEATRLLELLGGEDTSRTEMRWDVPGDWGR